MNLWLISALIASCLWGFCNVIDGAVRRHFLKSDFAATWFLAASRLPVILVLWALVPMQLPGVTAVFWMLIAGMLWIWPFIFYYKAMEFEEPSRVALLLEMINIFTLAFAFLLLNERLTVLQFIAFALLLLGGAAASIKHKLGEFRMSKAIFYILFACALWGLSDILFKKYAPAFPGFASAFSFYMFGSFLPSLGLLALPAVTRALRRNLDSMNRRGWIMFTVDQVAGISGTLFFAYALTLGKASLTSVILSIQTLFALGFGLLLCRFIPEVHKEDIGKENLFLKAISFVFIVAGLLIINKNV